MRPSSRALTLPTSALLLFLLPAFSIAQQRPQNRPRGSLEHLLDIQGGVVPEPIVGLTENGSDGEARMLKERSQENHLEPRHALRAVLNQIEDRDLESHRLEHRATDPEPLRAAAITKREPLRAGLTKREPGPEPFRAGDAVTKRAPEPFRAAVTKRDPEPEPAQIKKGVKEMKPTAMPVEAAETESAQQHRYAHWHAGPPVTSDPPMLAYQGAKRGLEQPHKAAHMKKKMKHRRAKRSAEELSDLEAREVEERAATQVPLAASQASSSAASAATSATSMVGSTSTAYFKGASSYYLFALADADRYAVLDALKSGGFTVVRIFIASVQQNNKGSNNAYVPDLEPKEVGAYDDTILSKVDQLMYDCKARGLKLIIALHDRYALGFWSTDTYATQFNIVAAGSSGAQKVSNAATFYTSSKAISSFQNRLKHILNHQNSLLGGKTWAQLSDVVYAFEAENEPQGHMATASSSWVCDRSKFLKTLLPSGSSIKISSGGGITTTDSLGNWAMGCSSLDIVSVHDYGTNPAVTVAAIVQANSVAKQSGKTVILGEWGITGSNKATIIGQFVSALKKAKVSWMYWEVVKPGKAASDFEVWTDEPSWAKLTA